MSKDISINEFYSGFCEEIALAQDVETYGWEPQDFFTAVMLGYLEEAGEIEDPIICPFRGYGLQLNAYHISESYDEVDVFVSVYKESPVLSSISRTDIDAAVKRGIQLYRRATSDLYTAFEKDSDTYEFAITLHNEKAKIKKARVIALTNGTVKTIPFEKIDLAGVEVSFSVWDVDRLYRCTTSGKMRETIEIDFLSSYGVTIPCIENATSDVYSVYLAILNGEFLAKIYEEHGPRLLERNVRSFLQVKGAVNKGIRDTLRDEPEMFLAYNNGISVTAESVEVVRDENGRPSIKKIRDMQIVNGGQTTASIYNAWKDKKLDVDLSRVFVQMKLSVISTSSAMDEIVPKISAFANTQNKIQMADFSANDPFHRRIEELSRITWTPVQGGQKPQNWFYERARGQYADMLSKETTTLRRKAYKETHPLFTKTDLAKYDNTWDQMPYFVSEGAQKNFKKFTIRLAERGNFVPDAKYYERLIAKAILFRRTEKLVQQQQYGGYRANIVTYTIAYLSYVTGQRIDLDSIWRNQSLTPALEENIVEVSKFVQHMIVNPPGGANVGEWCKKQQCWNAIKEYSYQITDSLRAELVDMSASQSAVISSSSKASASSLNITTEEERTLIDKASAIAAAEWYALSKWAKETDNFQGWQRSIVFSVAQLIARNHKPSYKQAVQALKVYEEAVQKGFNKL